MGKGKRTRDAAAQAMAERMMRMCMAWVDETQGLTGEQGVHAAVQAFAAYVATVCMGQDVDLDEVARAVGVSLRLHADNVERMGMMH